MNDLPHLEAEQVQNYANFSTPQNMEVPRVPRVWTWGKIFGAKCCAFAVDLLILH